MEEQIVPQIKFEQLCNASQTMHLMENRVFETVFVNGKEYVITGTESSGREGWISCWGNLVVDQHNYTGKLKPLTYWPHHDEVQG